MEVFYDIAHPQSGNTKTIQKNMGSNTKTSVASIQDAAEFSNISLEKFLLLASKQTAFGPVIIRVPSASPLT